MPAGRLGAGSSTLGSGPRLVGGNGGNAGNAPPALTLNFPAFPAFSPRAMNDLEPCIAKGGGWPDARMLPELLRLLALRLLGPPRGRAPAPQEWPWNRSDAKIAPRRRRASPCRCPRLPLSNRSDPKIAPGDRQRESLPTQQPPWNKHRGSLPLAQLSPG